MFNFIHNNKRLVQILLALFALPFLFFGVDSYFREGPSRNEVATVGSHAITQFEFNQALRERQETLARLMGGRVDSALLDGPEMRGAVLDGLIQQRLLLDRALRSGMTVSDQQLQMVIREQPAFQEDGKFSFRLYEDYLRRQGRTPVSFEQELRQDIMLQQVDDAFRETVFVPRSLTERIQRVLEQQREMSVARIEPERFVKDVKLAEGAAKKYYEENREEFRVPEQVRVAYVALSAESLIEDIKVDPAEVRKAYEARRSEFEAKEERQAAHILITVDAGASAEAKKAARAKAQGIYEQLKKDPKRFAELAKAQSQDPGSAGKGGDLGWFTRGLMVKAFDDAVFKMSPGEISPPVETEFGYHVIRLEGVRGSKGRSFEQVREALETDLKKNQVGRRYAAAAENFNNTVFEQFDTLKPAAELARSPIRESGWITRASAEDPRLNNPKLLQSIFSEEVLKDKRNTEAVEVAPGVLVAARVIEHKPSSIKPFEQVQAEIGKMLVRQQAAQLAVQEGREQLERARQGKDAGIAWGKPQLVSRTDLKEVTQQMALAAFRVPATKLPAYTGVELPEGGFALIRVSRVIEAEKLVSEKTRQLAEGLREARAQEEMRAFLASLRAKTEVKVSKGALERKDQ